MDKRINFREYEIKNSAELIQAENEHRFVSTMELYPWAENTPWELVVENIADRYGDWKSPVYLTHSTHKTELGMRNLCQKAAQYIEELSDAGDYEPLSISAGIHEDKIHLIILVRSYSGIFNLSGFFNYIGDAVIEEKKEDKPVIHGQLIIPDEVKNFKYTEEELRAHQIGLDKQKAIMKAATKEQPFLNSITQYIPKELPRPEDYTDLIYDLEGVDRQTKTIGTYESFTEVFREIMTHVNGVEYYRYVAVMMGNENESNFLESIKEYTEKTYVKTGALAEEDVPAMMKKLHRSLFQLYIIQDLIDDPKVSDIDVTDYNCIQCRVGGTTYTTNITFIDMADYNRFIEGLAIRNGISLTEPDQTFTDDRDENYILRFSLTAPYVTSVGHAYLHIRKISRVKMMDDDLFKAGMFNEVIRDYLLDCGKFSRGVVFAGPPGSGKTIMLNWFLERAYERSAEILVIQENDELFAYRKGVKFEHVVTNSYNGEQLVDLEDLGRMALVNGARVFVIGESKGGEICSAITLSNSGCRTALTAHSNSSTETIDKLADLAQRGYAKDTAQAKKMLTAFQTIVYLEGFKVREIAEVIGYDDELKDMKYRYIYRDPEYVPRAAYE